MKKLFTLTLILFALAAAASAAPSVTSTYGTATLSTRPVGDFTVYTLYWDSDTTGRCTANVRGVFGTIQRVTISPDTGDTSPTITPTNLYDATVTDIDGFDVLIGHGANLSSTTVTSFASMVEETTSSGCMPVVVIDNLKLTLTNAGADRVGRIRFYLKD